MGGNVTFPVLSPPWNNQPQAYNQYNLKFDNVSVPLLLKVQTCKFASLYAGPQIDFVLNAKADVIRLSSTSNEDFKDSIEKTDFSLVGGIQLFPQKKLHVDLRYIFGTKDVWSAKSGDQFNQAFQVTLGLRLFGKKTTVLPPDKDGDGIYDKDDKCPDQPGVKEYDGCPIPDTDGDGINDKEDKCPTVKGVLEYQGCPIPDTDGDGINDKEDKCPTVAGVAEYQGCPIPDTDGDGINDKEDKCPTVAGVAEYQGCPIPDTDGDGLNDKEDRCPTLAGPRENQGCPVIAPEVKKRVDYAANYILFATGKYQLLSKSYKGLDEVVKILQDNPLMKLSIDGHTDNVGADELNQTLSQNRANAVKDYFVSKGIAESRLTSLGHGETTPIADNKTSAGRQKNRRVEMKLSY
jgi:outer membrane protein OmpA-like peptidoglycan-associated protein